MQLPSHIKADSADAYNFAYTVLYCKQPKEIRDLIDKAKADNTFSNRFTVEFFKEVARMAQYQHSNEDLKALERREKMEGVHPSQQKKVEIIRATGEIVNGELIIKPISDEAKKTENQNPSQIPKTETPPDNGENKTNLNIPPSGEAGNGS